MIFEHFSELKFPIFVVNTAFRSINFLCVFLCIHKFFRVCRRVCIYAQKILHTNPAVYRKKVRSTLHGWVRVGIFQIVSYRIATRKIRFSHDKIVLVNLRKVGPKDDFCKEYSRVERIRCVGWKFREIGL